MKPLRMWKSPRTGVEYPVSMQLNDLRLEPLMDDQELDSRLTTGTDLLGRCGPGFQEQRHKSGAATSSSLVIGNR